MKSCCGRLGGKRGRRVNDGWGGRMDDRWGRKGIRMGIVTQFLEGFRQVVGVTAWQRTNESHSPEQTDRENEDRNTHHQDQRRDLARLFHTFIIPELLARRKVAVGSRI